MSEQPEKQPTNRFEQLENEAKKLKEAQSNIEKQFNPEEKVEQDSRSVHIGNVLLLIG